MACGDHSITHDPAHREHFCYNCVHVKRNTVECQECMNGVRCEFRLGSPRLRKCDCGNMHCPTCGWLEYKAVEDKVPSCRHREALEKIKKERNEAFVDVKKMIEEAMECLIDGTDDWYRGVHCRNKFIMALDRAATKSTSEIATRIATAIVTDAIGTEKFIDDVVERIQKKQVK